MKKLITFFCAGLITIGLSAQTDQGSMMIGVNSNLSYQSTTIEDGDAVSTMNVGGTFGYFLMENIAGVASFGYSKTGEADAVTSFGIGARYYMNNMYGGLMYSVPGEDMSDITINVGYLHMLTDNISLEPSLGYTMHTMGDLSGSTIGLNVGFGLYF